MVLRREENRREVLALLEMVGIIPSTGGRDAIDSWLAGHTRADNEDINSAELPCHKVLPSAPTIIGEWNTCLDWMGVDELYGRLWTDIHSVATGDFLQMHPESGLGPDATFADVVLEVITNPWTEDFQGYGTPLDKLHQGMWERWEYEGAWAGALVDPSNQMKLADWCSRLCELVVTRDDYGQVRPDVGSYEVWT